MSFLGNYAKWEKLDSFLEIKFLFKNLKKIPQFEVLCFIIRKTKILNFKLDNLEPKKHLNSLKYLKSMREKLKTRAHC